MSETVIVIDGNSLLNRAYYAIRTPMITSTGLYTQGVYAFINMLNKLIKDYEPDYLSVAFDRKAPTFRHKQYKDYKAGRRKTPPELLMEFPLLKEVLAAKNISILEIDGYEADDILGTVSLAADERGMKTYVVTGDRDAFQLASENTTVIYTKRGVSVFDAFDEEAIEEEYGFSSGQFVDYKALMGDKSDNLPGIPGVGDKTARKLVIKYGSLENVIQSVDTMKKSKMRDNIEEHSMDAMMSKRLATIFRQVPVEYSFDELRLTEPDYDKLAEVYRKLEFRSFLKKLVAGGHVSPAAAVDDQADQSQDVDNAFDDFGVVSSETPVTHVEDADGLAEALDTIKSSRYFWLKVFHDNSHISVPVISSVCLASAGHFYIVHWQDSFAGIFADFFREDGPGICGHDIKPDLYALITNGAAKLSGGSHIFNTVFDSAVAAYLIEPARRSYDLSELMPEYFNSSFPENKTIDKDRASIDMFGSIYDTEAKYGLMILSSASELAVEESRKLSAEELVHVFNDIEMPLVEVLASMEAEGVRTDSQVLNVIGETLSERVEELTKLIHAAAGEDFNINSPKQLGHILFEKMGLKNGKKTKTGYSTSAEVLEKIKDQNPIVPMVLEYRTLTKLIGTYVDGMLPLIDKDSRIHAHFMQTVAATGRLSCTEPNLQNIPVRTDLGRQFRKAFTASEDKILVGADYSQIELRVMAHLSGDEAMISSFEEGKDIHTITASRVFDVPEEKVTKQMRSNAKAVNFGVIYGISSYGLSKDIGISVREAQEYIDTYFDKHPGVRRYMDECVAFCKAHGYVKTLSGRRRYIKEINAKNYMTKQFGERLAMNSPVQGSAADIIKVAMINTYRALNEKCPGSKLVLQIHDELIIDTAKDEEEKVSLLLEECMSNAVSLTVPLLAEVGSGSSWFELK